MMPTVQESRDVPPLRFSHFPTRWQAVVWRNWELAPIGRIAAALDATEAQIRAAAGELGLAAKEPSDSLEAVWAARGYITIIRANWHILPYRQLLNLLDWTEDRLAFTLKEDDFLGVKLGNVKPWLAPVRYRELTVAERERTLRIKAELAAYFGEQDTLRVSRPDRFEHQFAFLHGWSDESADRAVPLREPEPGEVRLDVSWTIAVPPRAAAVRAAAERFAANQRRVWGAAWEVREAPPEEDRVLRIAVVPDSAGKAESHVLSIAPLRIELTAVDEAGALRGLQWITRQQRRRRVPYLPAGEFRRDTKFDARIIYSYGAVYGDPLLEPELAPYPDDLLERLSDIGVNGVWLSSVLYGLVPWAPDAALSLYWERRIAELRLLVRRAARYGIGVYLYCNEPRAMPQSFFDNRPDWRGHAEGGYAALCTSHPEVQRLLGDAITRLFAEVPDLAGLFTISMSENLTHCYSRAAGGRTNCPRCCRRSPGEVTGEVNRLIAEAAFRAKPDARVLSWTWGWSEDWGWTEADDAAALAALPDKTTVMCTSEEAMPTNVAGIAGRVIDYAMSVVGPGERSLRMWERARSRGLRTAAKVQFNNTWECSAVPFLPVFQLLETHLNRLNAANVDALLLSWTLGGYPSLNLELAAEYYWETTADTGTVEKAGLSGLLNGKFGNRAGPVIAEAASAFSAAFREFPFHLNVLYLAPQNYGPANLLYLEPTGRQASMIGFPYDDLAGWKGCYPEAVFEAQFRKLAAGWRRGLRRLEQARKHIDTANEREFRSLMSVAAAAYLHFSSTCLQIRFVRTRARFMKARQPGARLRACRKLIELARLEADNAAQLHALAAGDSRIGFEASNHYYYTSQDLKEKVLNCLDVICRLEDKKAELADNL